MKNFSLLIVTLFTLNGAIAQWTQQNSGTAQNLTSVHFVDANIGFAVGESGTILRTNDGGTTWQSQYSGIFANLNSVFFVDSIYGYAVGDANDVPIYGWVSTILMTVDGGFSWSNSAMGAVGNLESVYFIDATGYAVGSWEYPWTGGGSIAIKTTNGGLAWSTVYNGPSDCSAFCVSFTDPDTGYFVSSYSWAWSSTNWIEKTTDGGGTWTQHFINVAPSHDVISDVHFLDRNTGYAVGCTGTPLYDGLIKKTIDGGISWSSQYIDSTSFKSVHFPSSNIGYIVGDNGIIVKTSDSGTTWLNQISGINNDLTDVYFVDENTGYVVGKSGTILKTTNGGGYTGVNNLYSNSNPLRIYPNPSSDKINISTSTKGHLSILNLNGQQLLQQEIKDPKTTIDLCTLPSGVYMLKLVGEKGIQMGKISKK